MPNRLVGIFKLILVVLLLAYSFYLIDDIWQHPRELQWDLMIYFYGAEAYGAGLNPYEIESLEKVSGESFHLAFVYPPVALPIFRTLNFFSYNTVYRIWLVLKLLSLAGLIYLWRKYFIRNLSLPLILFFTLFAFDASVYWDIKAGNISIFEQLMIWLAFVFFLKRKPLLFLSFIIAASYFKFTPALFLALLPLSDFRRKWHYLGASVAILSALILINYFSMPELFRSFIGGFTSIAERGSDYNYGMLAFISDLTDVVGSSWHAPVRSVTTHFLYTVTIMVIILFSARAIIRAGKQHEPLKSILFIFIACVTYALLLPRFKCYSFIILIPPSLFIMRYYLNTSVLPFILLLLVLPGATPLPDSALIDRFKNYYPLYMAGMIWVMFMIYIKNLKETSRGMIQCEIDQCINLP